MGKAELHTIESLTPDTTFNFVYGLSFIVISTVTFFGMLESILKKNMGESYNLHIDKFVLFLNALLLCIFLFLVMYYFRKFKYLRYVPDISFIYGTLFVNTILIGVMGIVLYADSNKKENTII